MHIYVYVYAVTYVYMYICIYMYEYIEDLGGGRKEQRVVLHHALEARRRLLRLVPSPVITLEPRVECYKSRDLHTSPPRNLSYIEPQKSPPRNLFTFLQSSCS